MIIGKDTIKLAFAIAQEERDYHLEQIKKDNAGERSEEYDVNDFIILSEIIIPAIESGLAKQELDTGDFQKQRVFIMALEAYMANHLADLNHHDYGLLVKMKIGLEDELIREYEHNIKPEHWHMHEDHILEERERTLNLIKHWNKKRKGMNVHYQ